MKMSKKGNKGKFLLGALVGAGLGVLFAPKKGSDTRKDLKKKIDELVEKAKNTDLDDVKEYVVTKTEEIENALKDLDKEKVLDIAKSKAKEIEKSVKDLANYAKKKGTPVLEEAAESLRQKAIEVTKSVLEKLEK